MCQYFLYEPNQQISNLNSYEFTVTICTVVLVVTIFTICTAVHVVTIFTICTAVHVVTRLTICTAVHVVTSKNNFELFDFKLK